MPLHPKLQKFVDDLEANRGFDIKWLTRGTAFHLVTRHHTYTAIIADAEKNEVVLYCSEREEIKAPRVFLLQGSTAGGSVVRINWIGIGARLRFSIPEGGMALLSTLENIEFIESSAETERLLTEAEARKLQPATPEKLETARKEMWKWIAEKLAGPDYEECRKLIENFCFPNGQAIIASLLVTAREHGKLSEAIARVKRDYEKHWHYRPPEIRGEFITPSDVACLETAYRDLELPLPQEKK